MREDRDEGGPRGATPRVQTTRTVRFAALVAAAGQPEVYLPLFDPKQDRKFMRAVREHRVLSIRQEPTSRRADFGMVGFNNEKHTTLLVFPRPLTAFLEARVIGIKYETVAESRIAVAVKSENRSARRPKAQPQTGARGAKRR
jgi:hypothetical protein